MKLFFNQIQPNIPWKAASNNNVTIIPKNVKNELPNNNNIIVPWKEECPVKKYKFHANPIRHYRKQYSEITSKANIFSNISFIGSMDKPGNNIVTHNIAQNETNCASITYIQSDNDCKTLNSDKFYDPALNKVICSSLHPSALVIKRANTRLSTDYASSHRELLYKNNKSFIQNLPLNNNTAVMITNCNDTTSCITFNPSNKKYQTQGPITSSARIASLKYDCGDCPKTKSYNNKCPPGMPLDECNELTKILNSPLCYGCINDKAHIRRKRINILK